jgi:hypothetical protein
MSSIEQSKLSKVGNPLNHTGFTNVSPWILHYTQSDSPRQLSGFPFIFSCPALVNPSQRSGITTAAQLVIHHLLQDSPLLLAEPAADHLTDKPPNHSGFPPLPTSGSCVYRELLASVPRCVVVVFSGVIN